jgi:hypothetical protein
MRERYFRQESKGRDEEEAAESKAQRMAAAVR